MDSLNSRLDTAVEMLTQKRSLKMLFRITFWIKKHGIGNNDRMVKGHGE